MSRAIKSIAIGIVSGAVTYPLAVYALARTSALALPAGFPMALWVVLVIFGLGVTLVAFFVHAIALTLTRSSGLLALTAFAATFALSLAVSGLLTTGVAALTAAVIGGGLATLATTLRSNNSFKPSPLRGLGAGTQD